MALMLETADGETGVLIDHALALKKIYSNVQMVRKYTIVSSTGTEEEEIGTQTFRSCIMRSDLFDIHEPYKMDSQVCAEQGAKDKEKLQRKKKRKRKIELNVGELEAREYHSKIVQRISEVHRKLILKAKEMKYIEDKIECKAKNVLEAENESGLGTVSPEYQQPTELDNNRSARQAARIRETDTRLRDVCQTETLPTRCQSPVTMLEHVQLSKCVNTVIDNDWDNPRLCHIDGESYIIPHKSTFLLSDVNHHSILYPNPGDELYDLIVLDPPWQNKSVKRKKMYGSLRDEDLLDIHMEKLAAPGCLVVVWVTNRMKHLSFVKETLFPNWAVTYLAEWHWLKITKYGEMVNDINSNHKKPYEIILIGRYSGTKLSTLHTNPHSGSDGKQGPGEHTKQYINSVKCDSCSNIVLTEVDETDCGRLAEAGFEDVGGPDEHRTPRTKEEKMESIHANHVIISVPCALHSMKPPLFEVLKKYLRENPRCLELFARNLWPGWTSWGNEVLLHQHMDFYEVG